MFSRHGGLGAEGVEGFRSAFGSIGIGEGGWLSLGRTARHFDVVHCAFEIFLGSRMHALNDFWGGDGLVEEPSDHHKLPSIAQSNFVMPILFTVIE